MLSNGFEWQCFGRVTEFDELVAVGDRLLAGFQQGLGKCFPELWCDLSCVDKEVYFCNSQ